MPCNSRWIRPKSIEGKWLDPFDPYLYEHGFNESNGAESHWFVPQDLKGLAALMGGEEAAATQLNAQFEEARKLGFTSGSSHALETHPEYRRIPINYGNQPSIQTAFIFNHLGRPDLTQYWSRQVATTAYGGLNPDTGYNGDEDQGLMGALAVLMKIGLFQMTGGTEEDPVYELASPIFDHISIQLHPDYYPGGKFEISVQNNGPDHPFLQSANLNGKPIQGYSFPHSALVKGGKLELVMGPSAK